MIADGGVYLSRTLLFVCYLTARQCIAGSKVGKIPSYTCYSYLAPPMNSGALRRVLTLVPLNYQTTVDFVSIFSLDLKGKE